MSTTKTVEGPLSQYLKELRRKLRRPEDDVELPQTVFGRSLGAGRHPSSINKVEHGLIRPSDEFLKEIAEAYPKVADLKKMIELRHEQFGTEEQWSELRRQLTGKKGTAKKAAPRKTAAKKAPAAPAKAAASTKAATSSPSAPPARTGQPVVPRATERAAATTPPAGGKPGSLRSRVATPAVGAFGVRATPPAASVPAGDQASTAAVAPAVRGQHSAIFAEIMPVLQSLTITLAPASAMRLVAAAVVVIDRLRSIYAGAQGLGLMDMRAAAIAFASDLYSLLSGDVSLDALDPAQFKDVKSLVDLDPERSAAHDDLVQVLQAILSPVLRGENLPEKIEILVLRTLALGARR